MDWFTETLHGPWQQRLQIDEVLFRAQTDHQDLIIFRNADYGTVMALDGIVQTTEADEFIYHEMIAHVPILAHGAAREVLIVGGGDGGTLREVLRHPGVDRATMVEIDGAVVEMSKTWLPNHSAGAFDDPRCDLVIADGLDFVKTTDRVFDVVIVDSTDPIGPGEVLFGEPFYADCAKILTRRGILTTQNGVPWVQGSEIADSRARLTPHFDAVTFYLASVPTYVGGDMAFGFATHDPAAAAVGLDTLRTRFDAGLGRNETLPRHYAPEVHAASFALPPWIRAAAGL